MKNWLSIAFLLSFLAVGVPYWLIPYNKVNLPNALMEPGLFLVVCAPLVLRACSVSTFWRTLTIVGAAVPAVVITRVVWDGLKDPSSHNLWPVEVIIALILGFACALGGAVVGGLVSKLVSRHVSNRKS